MNKASDCAKDSPSAVHEPVCPEHITITDNASIPLKSNPVVDEFYHPSEKHCSEFLFRQVTHKLYAGLLIQQCISSLSRSITF